MKKQEQLAEEIKAAVKKLTTAIRAEASCEHYFITGKSCSEEYLVLRTKKREDAEIALNEKIGELLKCLRLEQPESFYRRREKTMTVKDMTVKDMIKRLSDFDKDAPIFLYDGNNRYDYLHVFGSERVPHNPTVGISFDLRNGLPVIES